ncbi:membrane protein [Vallitalea longa]|uniref:Membrane protein n=1 Tax=Vallitalea longa TaxID=2936439 RepID=A0A9W6DDF5_9FIRM|nr:small multi-drug export protein [Vallitalea longa]GKX28065.1 membrane protein [Vallitalea longa]
MDKLLQVFISSMLPIVEQKGAILLGILSYDIDVFTVFFVSLIGSLLPAPFILLFFNKIFSWMKKYKFFVHINNIIDKKIAKNSKKIEKRKELALIIFVGIPLPTTGVWTGSAVAAFLNLDFKKSMLCIILGAIISAVLITIISLTFPSLWNMSL